VSVSEVFGVVQGALEAAGVPYMVTGSFASAVHGEPRASKDIDVVIAPTREQLIAFLRQLPPGRFHADEHEALDALEHRSMFNIIDYSSGWRVDLILRKNRPFSETEFGRRRRERLAGLQVSVATAEDVLISKLEWAKLGESARQLEDAASILRIQGDALDLPYVEHWIGELGLEEQWRAAKRGAA
jgi:hypothetical protein